MQVRTSSVVNTDLVKAKRSSAERRVASPRDQHTEECATRKRTEQRGTRRPERQSVSGRARGEGCNREGNLPVQPRGLPDSRSSVSQSSLRHWSPNPGPQKHSKPF